jgi:hypothetical protein
MLTRPNKTIGNNPYMTKKSYKKKHWRPQSKIRKEIKIKPEEHESYMKNKYIATLGLLINPYLS